MSDFCTLTQDQLCGCCTGLARQTPQTITNRSALSTVHYRTGTHATFNASMLAALSDQAFPALAPLRTRDTYDFTIALIDAWSLSLDILTFYQERFANEAFLRTAVDQRSVFELARLVGYAPSPGVAASAVLAFTLSSAAGSPDNVAIPAGTRVQSVPGPGEKPQVFETSSSVTAVIAHNAMPAQTSIPWQLQHGDSSTWIAGSANNINVGDALLFLEASVDGQPSPSGPGDFRYVSRVHIDPLSGNTQVWWNAPIANVATSATSSVAVYIFRKKAALFGALSINPFLLPADTLANIPGSPTAGTKKALASPKSSTADLVNLGPSILALKPTDWIFVPTSSAAVNLDAAYAGLSPSGTSPDRLQWLLLDNTSATAVFAIASASESNPNRYALSAKTSELHLSSVAVLAGSPGATVEAALTAFTKATRSTTAFVSSNLLTPAELPLTRWAGLETFSLATGMVVPVQGTSVTVVGGQSLTAPQPIAISGKRARLQVASGSLAIFTPAGSSGYVPVTDNQVFYADAFPPSLDSSGTPLWSVTTLSGISGTLAIGAGNLQLLPAEKADTVVSEAALVGAVLVSGDLTTLTLQSVLSGIYDATSVRVNGNAVESTHGETVQEILGNGDGTNPALQFTLKQPPLTYTTASTGNGTQSTLRVWVNNLEWHETPNMLQAGALDRVFVSRVSPGGSRFVQFGNGVQGARTPTGQMNIRAVYRKGIGSAGMVRANQLSQALDRPQGVKAVTNPGPASGAADPATSDAARTSAPLPALTIGRIVSLEDYQNFALNFAGIAKALATWTWLGTRRGVLLTVAGVNGAVLQGDDPVVLKLSAAIQSHASPFVPLQIAAYEPLLFQIKAGVKVDTYNYDPKQVLAQVWSNLQKAFAFDQRRFAQNVAGSEMLKLLQNTPGVLAVRLSSLALSNDPASSSSTSMLCAFGPRPPLGAQMLLLDAASQSGIGVWA